jgi:hypothetical protein
MVHRTYDGFGCPYLLAAIYLHQFFVGGYAICSAAAFAPLPVFAVYAFVGQIGVYKSSRLGAMAHAISKRRVGILTYGLAV